MLKKDPYFDMELGRMVCPDKEDNRISKGTFFIVMFAIFATIFVIMFAPKGQDTVCNEIDCSFMEDDRF